MILTINHAIRRLRWSVTGTASLLIVLSLAAALPAAPPNIVLVMADDMGWGETSYYQHPVLKTPHLDAMAAAGIRMDQFYAGGPVCSPTRASVLTGRTHYRCGVPSHGYALRKQERTLAQAAQAAGYHTGHFGKWHLNGLRGPGVPVLASDSHHPGAFGFDTWLSVTNFFDRNPILSRQGAFEEYTGDSSEIVIDQALEFIAQQAESGHPSLSVVWFGTPHSPFVASPADALPFANLDESSQQHYGELVAMDRSIGALRSGLRELGIAENTLVWFCSDNGGLPKISPTTVGKLRGFKGSLYEGGLRVPSIIEWPERFASPQISNYPACVVDIFPTLAEIVRMPSEAMLQPQDGISLIQAIEQKQTARQQPLFFHYAGGSAMVDNQLKLIRRETKSGQDKFELYDLSHDLSESNNLYDDGNPTHQELVAQLAAFERSLADSVAGKDYASGQVDPGEPKPQFWTEVEAYRPYFDAWKVRPEYKSRFKANN